MGVAVGGASLEEKMSSSDLRRALLGHHHTSPVRRGRGLFWWSLLLNNLHPIHSCSVDPRKLCVGVKYYIVHMYSMSYYTYGSTANFLFLGPTALIYIKTEKTLKNEQRSKDAAAKKRPNTSGVGKINNYYEDIYIPHNNTD